MPDRTTPRDRTLRVGNRERDEVVDILRHEHLEGRLDADEFQERLDHCLAAKTYADLDALIADFPAQVPQPERESARWAFTPWPLFLIPFVIAAIVFSHGRAFWLVFPLAFLVLRTTIWRRAGFCGARTIR
jgi:Domain of unknown function (DUF1707)